MRTDRVNFSSDLLAISTDDPDSTAAIWKACTVSVAMPVLVETLPIASANSKELLATAATATEAAVKATVAVATFLVKPPTTCPVLPATLFRTLKDLLAVSFAAINIL